MHIIDSPSNDRARGRSPQPLLRSPRFRAPFSLYCFASAGGSAANYLSWHAGLAPEVEVCTVELPGHGTRCFEAPYRDLDRIADEVAAAIRDSVSRPFGFFGHSLGALVAFEVARRLQAAGAPAPRVLLVSGCDPPRVEREPSQLCALDDDALIERLRTFNGTPAELLDDRDFMSLILPALRADFDIAGRYRYRPGPTLDAGIVVFTGHDDPHAPPARANGWAGETREALRVHRFPGGHFYYLADLPAFWQIVKDEVARLSGAAA